MLPPLNPRPKNEKKYECRRCGRNFKLERIESTTIIKDGIEKTKIMRRNPARCPSCGRSTHLRRKPASPAGGEVGK